MRKEKRRAVKGKGQSVMIHIRHVTEKSFLRLLTRFFFFITRFLKDYTVK